MRVCHLKLISRLMPLTCFSTRDPNYLNLELSLSVLPVASAEAVFTPLIFSLLSILMSRQGIGQPFFVRSQFSFSTLEEKCPTESTLHTLVTCQSQAADKNSSFLFVISSFVLCDIDSISLIQSSMNRNF